MFNNFVRSRDFVRQIMSKEFPFLRGMEVWSKGDRGSSRVLTLVLGIRWVRNSVLRLPRFSGKHRDNVKSSARPHSSQTMALLSFPVELSKKNPPNPNSSALGLSFFETGVLHRVNFVISCDFEGNMEPEP